MIDTYHLLFKDGKRMLLRTRRILEPSDVRQQFRESFPQNLQMNGYVIIECHNNASFVRIIPQRRIENHILIFDAPFAFVLLKTNESARLFAIVPAYSGTFLIVRIGDNDFCILCLFFPFDFFIKIDLTLIVFKLNLCRKECCHL